MTSIVLDVDTGIDDTFAILTAALAEGVDLVACTTTWGNVSVDQAARNTKYVLELAGRPDVPVARGAVGPSNGKDPWHAHFVHGEDGQGNVGDTSFVPELASETAAELIVRLSHEVPDLELVAVGPLSNLAAALAADPTLPERIRRVTVMGGAVLVPGNASPAAEANILHDPEAAAAVFEAGWSVTLVGLDVTMRARITTEHQARLAAAGRVGAYAARIFDFYLDYYERSFGKREAANHDALAVAVALGLAEATLAPVVEVVIDTTDGPNRGRTTADLRGMWAGWPAVPGARHRVVLEVTPGFEDRMVELIGRAG